MDKYIFSDINLCMTSTKQPTCEPTFEPSYVIRINNTSSNLSNDSLTNNEKIIIMFTLAGALVTVFILISLFFHIKSKTMRDKKKQLEIELLDSINDNKFIIVTDNNEINV